MKKRTKNSPIVIIVSMVVVTALVIGAFFYLRDRALKKEAALKEKSEITKLTSMDLEKDYPGNAREVIKLHNRFMKCYYNEELTDEEVKGLAIQNQKLYDKELLEKNPSERYIESLKQDILGYKEAKRRIVNDKIQDFAEAERLVKGGYNFCNILTSYFIKEDKSHINVNQKYYLREDENGHWKILFWEKTKQTF